MIVYPAHITEFNRIEMARKYCEHELRKILAERREVDFWFKTDDAFQAQIQFLIDNGLIRDFWNLVNGLSMGWKLKKLVGYLTSVNIRWQHGKINLSEITLNAMGETGRKAAEEGCATAGEIASWYYDRRNNALRLRHLSEHALRRGDSAARSRPGHNT